MKRLVLFAIQTVLLTLSLNIWWVGRSNTLFSNGRWISGKNTVKYLFFNYEYLFRPLEDSRLSLSRDMGYQEVLYHKEEGPERQLQRLKFDLSLDFESYLWIELRKSGNRFLGCRLSRSERFKGGFYRFAESGDLIEYTPFTDAPRLFPKGWRTVEVASADGGWRLSVDGRTLGNAPDAGPKNGRFGFRGSGRPRSEVLIRNIEMQFRNPVDPPRTWIEREDFSPRSGQTRFLGFSGLFALLALALRHWRQRLFEGFLPGSRVRSLRRVDDFGLTALLTLLLLALLRKPLGILIPLCILAGEAVNLVALVRLSRRPGPSGLKVPLFAGSSLGAALALLGGAAFAVHGEQLGRAQRIIWSNLKYVHPAAYTIVPRHSRSSPPLLNSSPVVVSPTNPYFSGGRVYREQVITADFHIPNGCVLEVVFQQQSFLTHGDPGGEQLPLQRRMLRLSTHPEVSSGFAVSTRRVPAEFARINGAPLPDTVNHLEIRSDAAGVRIRLNGEDTLLPRFKPLGFGETGFMVFEKGVTLRNLRIEATTGEAVWEKTLPLTGASLPLLLAAGFWALLRLGGRVPFREVATGAWAALYPLAFYLIGTLFLSRDTLHFMTHDRLAWLDLLLAASAFSHLGLLFLYRHRLRGLAIYANVCSLAAVSFLAVFVWDGLLPQQHPLKVRFADDVIVPGDSLLRTETRKGPWYVDNHLSGVNNYLWKQRLGGKRISAVKPPGRVRIFVVGGSQAWGAGAAGSEATFAALLEKKLQGKGLPVEVYNAGINGAGIIKVLGFYRGLLTGLRPDILLADIGLNDSAALRMTRDKERVRERTRILAGKFDELAGICRRGGVDLVLVLEPMSSEGPLRPWREYYEALEGIAATHGATVVQPGPLFRRKEERQVLWWDSAHLAPSGHELLASMLVPAVERVVRRRGEKTPRESVSAP